MSQIETTLVELKERSGEALEVVQHGVEALGTKLGLIEPKPRRRGGMWLLLVALIGVAVVTTIAVRRRSRSSSDAQVDHETAQRAGWSAAAV